MPLACAMAFSSGVVMKPATTFGIGAVIDRVDRDHGVLRLRILQDLQRPERAQAEHQDQQADDGGQHRAADEDVGELHGAARQ